MSEASKGGNPNWPLNKPLTVGGMGMSVDHEYGDSPRDFKPEVKS